MPDEGRYDWLDRHQVQARLLVGRSKFYDLRRDHPELEPKGKVGRKLFWTETQLREFQDKVMAGEVSV